MEVVDSMLMSPLLVSGGREKLERSPDAGVGCSPGGGWGVASIEAVDLRGGIVSLSGSEVRGLVMIDSRGVRRYFQEEM